MLFYVSYRLGNMFHKYTIESENEATAIQRVMYEMPKTSLDILHDFKIERRYK